MADAVWDPNEHDSMTDALGDADEHDSRGQAPSRPAATQEVSNEVSTASNPAEGEKSSHATTTQCPKCGVAVLGGYVACPKCNAKLAGFARSQTQEGGGTAVRSNPVPWLLVLAAAGITAGAWYLSERNPGQDNVAEAANETPAIATASVVSADRAARRAALDFLEQTLEQWQVAAWVDSAPRSAAMVMVYSHQCASEEMASALRAAEYSLASAGFSRALCHERESALMTTVDLVANERVEQVAAAEDEENSGEEAAQESPVQDPESD